MGTETNGFEGRIATIFLRRFCLLSFLLFSLVQLTHAESENSQCSDLLTLIHQSTKDDWTFEHGSTAAVLIGNASILTGAELLRAIQGQSSFNSDFVVNSSIDMTMTAIAHQIALMKLPFGLEARLNKTKQFFLRSGTNAILDFFILIFAWRMAAASRGSVIDTPETLGAAAFCVGTYVCLQLFRNKAFIDWPKSFDHRVWDRLEHAGSYFRVLHREAGNRALELGLKKEEAEFLLMTFLEHLMLKLPYEDRIPSDIEDAKIQRLVTKIRAAEKERRKIFYRQELVAHLLKASSELSRDQIMEILSLGQPFSKEQSLQVHEAFYQRDRSRRRLKFAMAAIDRVIGGVVAGGLIMRQMTTDALKD